MDFEFISYRRQDLVLISGAMSEADPDGNVTKLQGIPLVLSPLGNIRLMDESVRLETIRFLDKILKDKGKDNVYLAFLKELDNSYNCSPSASNLTQKTIRNYVGRKGPHSHVIIVLWNGSSDLNILNRLGVKERAYNMTAIKINSRSNYFILKMVDMHTKKVLVMVEIGKLVKLGTNLNLVEAHGIVCKQEHSVSYAHDPVTDVVFTRCLFNYLLNAQKSETPARAVDSTAE